MILLITYVACLIVGQSITIGIGVMIDRFHSPALSLPISIALYFAMFWVCWKIAVWLTEPRKRQSPEPQSSAPPPA